MKVKILKNKQVAQHAYKINLSSFELARNAKPGQFVMARVVDGYQPLLRRPFGIHSVKGSSVGILYELAGIGTRFLSQKQPGDYLDIIGPLGNGFDWRASAPARQRPVLIAGGMGVAPLVFLAEKLKTKPLVLLGAKTKTHILCEKEFKALGCEVRVATDDGSKGRKGLVTDITPEVMSGSEYVIYACGPKAMLKAVAEFAKNNRITAQVSLEEHMACGIGACLGCVCKTKNGYQRACKEGPVFDAGEITW